MANSRRLGSATGAGASRPDDPKKGPQEMLPSGWIERGWELKKLGGMWLLIGKQAEPEPPSQTQTDADVF